MAAFQKTCFTASSQQGQEEEVDLTFALIKDVCKRDMKACNINTKSWEAFADNRTMWKQIVSQGLESGEH